MWAFLIQHGEDNSPTIEQGNVGVPNTAAACDKNRMKFKDCGVR